MCSVAFARFWQTDLTRECFMSFLPKDDLRCLRLACKEFAADAAPILFRRLEVHFTTNTFSRRSRMSALERIGHHVQALSFVMPHHSRTFLPPLLVPGTLNEVTFLYEPHINTSRPTSSGSSATSSSTSSKYGSPEMNDLLVKQYPPLFHAATDVDSFFRAFCALPKLRSLQISCPDQPAGQRYRRNVVDYALISLRLAIETANPPYLEALTLAPIHPAAILHLRPHLTIGSTPASSRLWLRIKKLDIEMDSFEYGRDQPSDHLKILHGYLQALRSLEDLRFHWIGSQGPCPIALHMEPCTSRPTSLLSSNSCPNSSTKSSFRPLKFRHLKTMFLSNASLDASQASGFIMSHRKVLHEFQFDRCHLRSGTWDDALAPLTRIIGNDSWKGKQEEVMEVPLVLSPLEEKTEIECVQEPMWEDALRRSRGFEALRKVGLRTREMVPEQVKRLLRTARVAWH